MSQSSENEKFLLKWNGTMGWKRSRPMKVDF